MSQLALALEYRAAQGRDDFLVGPSNEVAVAWVDRWPDWPAHALALYGPSGCGKSHLVQVWLAASGARAIEAETLRRRGAAALMAEADSFALDAIDLGLRRCSGSEEQLLHLYNRVAERGGHLLLAACQPPSRWPVALADLRSRLTAIPTESLGAPDDRLLQALLVKLFADRQLEVAPEVVRFVLARMERSFAGARRIVTAADRASLAARREITVPLMREVLELDGQGGADPRDNPTDAMEDD